MLKATIENIIRYTIIYIKNYVSFDKKITTLLKGLVSNIFGLTNTFIFNALDFLIHKVIIFILFTNFVI